jgi:hypothetical protein
MSVSEPHAPPSSSDLRWFGLIVFAFFGILGALVAWQAESTRGAFTLGCIGAALAIAYYGIRSLRRPLYAAWMAAVAPIGLLVSTLLLGVVYYLVLTPTALLIRLFGRDPLDRRFEAEAGSYWREEDPGTDAAGYFRQS